MRGGVILDNCMGSGTTILAAIKERRHYIGIEIEEEFYKIASRRIYKERTQLELF